MLKMYLFIVSVGGCLDHITNPAVSSPVHIPCKGSCAHLEKSVEVWSLRPEMTEIKKKCIYNI